MASCETVRPCASGDFVMISTLASVASKRKRPAICRGVLDLPRSAFTRAARTGSVSSFLWTLAPAPRGTVSTHRTVTTGLRRVPQPLPPNDSMFTVKIGPDLPVRPSSQDPHRDVRPIRRRQRPTPHQQLLYSTNVLLRGYDTATFCAAKSTSTPNPTRNTSPCQEPYVRNAEHSWPLGNDVGGIGKESGTAC